MSTLCTLGSIIEQMSLVSRLASMELIPFSTRRLIYLLSVVEEVSKVSLGSEVRIFSMIVVHLAS